MAQMAQCQNEYIWGNVYFLYWGTGGEAKVNLLKQNPSVQNQSLEIDAVPNEWMILILLTGQIFFLALALSLLEIAGSSLFLVDFGSEMLPYVYIAIAIFVSSLSYVYAELQKRWPLTRVSIAAVAMFTCIVFLAWLGLTFPDFRWISFALMVIFTLGYQMAFVVIGGQAGRLFDVRQMKRLFPIVLTGLTVGFMAGGLVLPLLTLLLGPAKNLLLAAGISMLVNLALLLATINIFRPQLTQVTGGASKQTPKSLPQLLQKRYVILIFVYQMLSAVGTQLVLFIFLDQAKLHYPAVEDLAQFFGNFTIVLNLLLLLFLATPSGYLLNRFGLSFGLTVNPIVVGVIVVLMVIVGETWGASPESAFSAAVLLPGVLFFWLAGGARIFDIMLSVGITSPSIKATYQAMPGEDQAIVETAVEGMGVPIAFGIAGVTLIIFNTFGGLTLIHLINFTLVITIIWAAAGFLVYKGYRGALLRNLSRRILSETELSLTDSSSLTIITNLLKSPKLSVVRLALDLLERVEHESLDPSLITLVNHPDAAIRTEALVRIERRQVQAAYPMVEGRLQAEVNPSAKGAALQAWCALTELEAVPAVKPYLADSNPEIQLGAMVGLLRYGGIPGVVAAWEDLKDLAQSADPIERAFVARVIGEVGLDNFYQPLLPLLIDQEIEVRLTALVAAGKVGHARLFPLVVNNLADTATRSAAMSALITSVEVVLPLVAQALAGETRYDEETVRRLVRACGQIKGEGVINLLKQYINHPHAAIQYQVLFALHLSGYWVDEGDQTHLEPALRGCIRHGLRAMLAKQDIGQDEGLAPLHAAIDQEFAQVRQRLCLLLSFIYDARAMLRAEERLVRGGKAEKALAIEALDVTLSRAQKALILPLVDESLALTQRVRSLSQHFSLSRLGRDERLQEIITDPQSWSDGWTRACAIYASGKLMVKKLAPAIEGTLPGSGLITTPPVRETTIWALAALAPDVYQRYVTELATDPNPRVTQSGDRKTMLLTIEKVALLKSVSIFTETPDSVLAPVATIVDEVYVEPGETFIHEGDMGDSMYVIIAGEVRVHSGQKTILTLGPGKSVGELAVLDPEPRVASVTAIEETQLFRIDRDAFSELIADRPEIAQGVIRALCQRVRMTTAGN